MENFPTPIEASLKQYIFQLADTNLILSHRLSELCGHGPELEQDIALTNIALDLLGQAQFYFQILMNWEGESRNEDQLAFLRLEHEYNSLLLAEQPNVNFGHVVVRQYVYDVYHYLLLRELQNFHFTPLKEVAQKAISEVKYHKNWSKEWVLTLGDGTEESKAIIIEAFKALWPYAMEFSQLTPYQKNLQRNEEFFIDFDKMRALFLIEISETLKQANLSEVIDFIELSEKQFLYQYGGKEGRHTENLGYILSEIQYMQRLYPNCEW